MRAVALRLSCSALPVVLGFLIVLSGSPVPARPIFLVLAPALAVLVPLTGTDPLARVLFATSAVVVIDGLVAEVMLAVGIWSPAGGTLVVAVVSTLLWAALGGAALVRRRRANAAPDEPAVEVAAA